MQLSHPGILIRSKGHRDVQLFFDKASGLLVKRAHSILEGTSGKSVLQEIIYSHYEAVHGLKYPRQITAWRDGRRFATVQVIEVEFFNKLDERVFAKPSNPKPP